MYVDPNPEALVVAKCAISDLNGYLSKLLSTARYEHICIGPSSLTINDTKFARKVRVRLHKERLEDAFVGFDLPLEFIVFLRS